MKKCPKCNSKSHRVYFGKENIQKRICENKECNHMFIECPVKIHKSFIGTLKEDYIQIKNLLNDCGDSLLPNQIDALLSRVKSLEGVINMIEEEASGVDSKTT